MSERSPGVDWLVVAAVAFLGANLVHGADHLRTGTERLSVPVQAGGALITTLAILTLVLALRDHPRAALVAAFVGLSSALQIANAHLLPQWGVFSDSYVGESFDAFSWGAAILEVGTALALGLAGVRRLRAQPVPETA
jgi:hypothetical protein